MKIIDLLNKIANREEVPKKIRYKNLSYIYSNECKGYYLGTNPERIETFDCNRLYQRFSSGDMLNDEVEVIEMCHKCHKYPAEYNQTYCEFCLGISKEDKKIEKFETYKITDETISGLRKSINELNKDIEKKLNEIIDKINESEE